MGRILTQEEVDALLTTVGGPSIPEAVGPTKSETTKKRKEIKVTLYNFRRPERVPKEQMRSIHFLHESFARNYSSSLSAYLRALVTVSLVSVEQLTYGEFLLSLPDQTAIYSLSMEPLDGVCALEIDPSLAFPVIDRLLGGEGEPVSGVRHLTEIEQNIIEGVVRLATHDLREVWKPILAVSFAIEGREVRPQLLQVVSPSEVVVVMVFDVKVGEIRGIINFCIPYVVLEPVAAQFEREWESSRKKISMEERERLMSHLLEIPLGVTLDARDTTVTIRELLDLDVGDVIQLGTAVEAPLSLVVGGLPKLRGRPVVARGRKSAEIV